MADALASHICDWTSIDENDVERAAQAHDSDDDIVPAGRMSMNESEMRMRFSSWENDGRLFSRVATIATEKPHAGHLLENPGKMNQSQKPSQNDTPKQRPSLKSSDSSSDLGAHALLGSSGKELWNDLQRRVMVTGVAKSELWYSLLAPPKCIAVLGSREDAQEWITEYEQARSKFDDGEGGDGYKHFKTKCLQNPKNLPPARQDALEAGDYLVLVVPPHGKDATSQAAFQSHDYRCGFVSNTVEPEFDVGQHIDWDVKGDAKVATKYAMLKQGMYMWMTDDKKVPTQDHTDGGIACAMYHPEDQDWGRTPLPVERAAPWIVDGDDTGFSTIPDIYAPAQSSSETGDTSLKKMTVDKYTTWHTTSTDLGKLGGIGMRIYFTILMVLSFSFFVMGLLSIPIMYINSLGHNYPNGSPYREVFFTGKMIMYTYGNRNISFVDLEDGNIGALWVSVILDVLVTIGAMAFIYKVYKAKAGFLQKADDDAVTMGDFTVFVQPHRTILNTNGWKQYKKDDEESALADWIENKTAGALDHTLVGSLQTYFESTLSKQNNPDLCMINDAATVAMLPDGSPAIWPVYNQDKNIKLWRQKMNACFDLEEGIARLKKCRKDPDTDEEDALKAFGYVEKCLANVQTIQAKLINLRDEGYFAIGAFVSFEYAEDYESALIWGKQFHSSSVSSNGCGTPEGSSDSSYPPLPPKSAGLSKKNPNGVQITVKAAPEPEVIVWEHLQYNKYNRGCRSVFINAFSTCMLLIGIGVIVYTSIFKEALNWTTKCQNQGIGIGSNASFYRDYANTTSGTDTHEIGQLTPYGDSPYCDGLGTSATRPAAFVHYSKAWDELTAANTGYTFPQLYKSGSGHKCFIATEADGDAKAVKGAGGCCGLLPANMSLTWTEASAKGCHRNDNWETKRWVEWSYQEISMVSKESLAVLHHGDRDAICYACSCQHITGDGMDTQFQLDMPGGAEKYCKRFEDKKASAKLLGYVAVFVIVIVNQIVRQVLTMVVEFEKNHTMGSEQASVAYKVFIAQLFNTALLMLLLRWKKLPFNVDEYDLLFNGKWYAQIAAPLVMTMIIQFMVPPFNHVVQCFLKKFLRLLARQKTETQNGYQRVYASGQLQLAASYGEVLLALSVTLVYSTALPMLYFVAAFGFFIKFWVDKWAVLNVYMKPPLYGIELFEHFEEICFLMVTGKAFFGVVFYATLGGTSAELTGYSDPGSILRPHVIPMLGVATVGVLAITAVNCGRFWRNYTPWGRAAVIDRFREAQEGLIKESPRWKVKNGERVEVGEKRHPKFSGALAADMIVNEDDDYHMDEHEQMQEIQEAFMSKIESAHNRAHSPNEEEYAKITPFTQYKFAHQVYEAVKAPGLHAERRLTNCEDGGSNPKAGGYISSKPQAYMP